MDRTEIGNCIIAGIAESDNCLDQMSEIVTRLELAGWVIVPKEATQEMLESGLMAGTNLTTGQPSARLAARTAGERMTDQWRAMIHAALWPS